MSKTSITICAALALLSTFGVVRCINTPEPPPNPLDIYPKMCHVGEPPTFPPNSHRVRMTEETLTYRKYRVNFGQDIPWYYVTCDRQTGNVVSIWSE